MNNKKPNIISEFILDYTAADTERRKYHKKWVENEAFLFMDDAKLKSISKNNNAEYKTTQNLLWPIYNQELAELLSTQNLKITLKPNDLPVGAVDAICDKYEAELLKGLINDGSMSDEEFQGQIQQLVMQFRQQIYDEHLSEVNELGQIVRAVWDNSRADTCLESSFKDALVTGSTAAEIYLDINDPKKNVTIKHIPIYSCYLEPGIEQFQDSSYFICKSQTTILDIKNSKQFSEFISPSDMKVLEGLAQTNAIMNIYGTTSALNNTAIFLYRYYKKNKNGKISCYYILGNESTFILGYEVKDININFFPFSFLHFNKQPGYLYGKSLLEFLIPIQKLYNKYTAIIKIRMLQAARPHIFLAKNAGIDPKAFAQTQLTPGVVHLTNSAQPANSVYVAQLSDIPSDFVSFLNNLEGIMLKVSGQSEAEQGDMKVSGASSGATNAVMQQATLTNLVPVTSIKDYVNGIITIMIELITKQQTKAKGFYVKSEDPSDTKPSLLEYVGTDYSNIVDNLSISVDIKTGSEREKMKRDLLEIYQLGVQFPTLAPAINAKELISTYDLPNQEEIFRRMDAQEDDAIGQVAQQILQLVSQNFQLAMQQQEESMMAQQGLAEGTVNPQSVQEHFAQQPQPLQQDQMLQIITDLIKQDPVNAANQATSMNQQPNNQTNNGGNK